LDIIQPTSKGREGKVGEGRKKERGWMTPPDFKLAIGLDQTLFLMPMTSPFLDFQDAGHLPF